MLKAASFMKYPSDITTKQWNIIKHLFENENRGKHFQTQSKRRLINAVLYLNKTGCQWRQLSHDFPKWSTVKSFYYRAKSNGLWEKMLDLMVKKVRVDAGRKPTPSYCLIDSRSMKTTGAAKERGIDGVKKRKVENVIL